MRDAIRPAVRRRVLSAYPGSFGETEERKPKHVERNTMIGLRSDRSWIARPSMNATMTSASS
jgi:hypothetical protein